MTFATKIFLAAIMFISIQFMSMVGGVQFIATGFVVEVTSDLPHEDMSLEHVVPLDPFLGGTGHEAELARFSCHATAFCAMVFTFLLLFAGAVRAAGFERLPVGARRTSPRLWLHKRALLI